MKFNLFKIKNKMYMKQNYCFSTNNTGDLKKHIK